tara:strand:- start:21875 stop:24457 length:2583 start_codon:yes stop_codon:yes gene_type:complete
MQLARVIPTALVVALMACALLVPIPANATPKPTIAVSYFENNTGDDQYSPLARGLADMLITDLSSIAGAQIVERAKLNLLLDEIELSKSPFIDPATAVKMGRGLGARYIITGSFVSMEPKMRIDARIIDVTTGKIVHSAQVEGPVSEFFLLEKELALTLTEGIGIKLSAKENAKLGRVATDSFEAFSAWSKGLEAMDRGQIEVARRALDKALESDSGFGPAAKLLGTLKSTTEDLSSRRHAMLVSDAVSIIKALKKLKRKKGSREQVLNIVDFSSVESSLPAAARQAREITKLVMDLKVPDSVQFGAVGYRRSVNSWAMSTYFMASFHLQDHSDVVSYGQAFMKRYPRASYFRAVESIVNKTVSDLSKARIGLQTVPALHQAANVRRLELLCQSRRDRTQRVRDCAEFVKRIAASKTAEKKAERLEDGIEDLIHTVKKTPTAASLALAQKTIRSVSQDRDVLTALDSLTSYAEREQRDADRAPAEIQKITCRQHPQRTFRLPACLKRVRLSKSLAEKDLAYAIKDAASEASAPGYSAAEMQSTADFLATAAAGLAAETRVKERIESLRRSASARKSSGDAAAKATPRHSGTAKNIARDLWEAGRAHDAKRFVASVIGKYPNEVGLSEVLVKLALDQGDVRTAQSIADTFNSSRARAGKSTSTQLSRLVDGYKSKLASHQRNLPRELADAAGALFDAGRRQEAKKMLDAALGTFPTSQELNGKAVNHAEAAGDRAEGERALARWQRAVGVDAIKSRFFKDVQGISTGIEAEEVESRVQHELAHALSKADQWREAADLFLRNARTFPTGNTPERESLSQAASLYRLSGKIKESRTLYSEIIKRFDGSREAEQANVMLTMLPK